MNYISVEQIVLLLTKAEDFGISSQQILRDCNISFTLDDLRSHRIRHIAQSDFARICRRSIMLIRDRGWQGLGKLLSVEDLRLICHAMVSSLTLREAIQREVRIYDLLERKHGWSVLGETGDTARLEVGVGPGEQCWPQFFTPVACASFARLFDWLIGGDLGAVITLAAMQDSEHMLIASMLTVPTRFDQSFNGLIFPADRLDRPVVRNGLELREFLKVYPFDIFVDSQAQASLTPKVFSRYREAIMAGEPVPDIGALARSFGMSPATFRRYLDRETSSVRQIKDQVRHEIAVKLLNDESLPIPEIARQLDFSCANAFSRAFQEWQGDTPASFRRKLARRQS